MSEQQWHPERQNLEVRSEKPVENLPVVSPNPEPLIPNPVLLDLSAPQRWVAINAGGKRHIHTFSQLTAEDWLAYDRALRPTLRVGSDDSMESSSKTLLAAAELWNKKIVVSGSDWAQDRSSVPLRHQEEAVKGLGYVSASPDQDAGLDTEAVTVTLEALWNGRYFKNLTHRFKRPLVEHELRFQEALRRSAFITQKVGGQRRPSKAASEIISLPNLPTMLALYDELIVSTSGYTGSPMDALHKSCAIRALFNQSTAAELEIPGDEDDARS